MDISGIDGAGRCLQYVAPENINQALLCFSINVRAKYREKLFSPVTVKKELFKELLDQYVKEYSLSGMRVFTDSQLWALEQNQDCI